MDTIKYIGGHSMAMDYLVSKKHPKRSRNKQTRIYSALSINRKQDEDFGVYYLVTKSFRPYCVVRDSDLSIWDTDLKQNMEIAEDLKSTVFDLIGHLKQK